MQHTMVANQRHSLQPVEVVQSDFNGSNPDALLLAPNENLVLR